MDQQTARVSKQCGILMKMGSKNNRWTSVSSWLVRYSHKDGETKTIFRWTCPVLQLVWYPYPGGEAKIPEQQLPEENKARYPFDWGSKNSGTNSRMGYPYKMREAKMEDVRYVIAMTGYPCEGGEAKTE